MSIVNKSNTIIEGKLTVGDSSDGAFTLYVNGAAAIKDNFIVYGNILTSNVDNDPNGYFKINSDVGTKTFEIINTAAKAQLNHPDDIVIKSDETSFLLDDGTDLGGFNSSGLNVTKAADIAGRINANTGGLASVGIITKQDNSSSDTVFLSDSYNNKGIRLGNAGYGTISGFQDSNNTASGSAYGLLVGLNTFYDGTNFSNDNQYVDPSSILFRDGDIRFHTNDVSASGTFTPTEIVRIDKSGNVGIGTESPETKLHVKSGSVSTFTGTGEHHLRIESDSTNNQYTGIGFAQGSGADIAKIAMKRTSSGSHLYFGTSNNYGNGVTNSALVIDHSGKIGIGDATPSYELDVDGTIRATGDVIAYSDERVKENIKTIENASEKVSKLRGVEFNKIGEDSKSIGVIAQEVEKVIPEVVKTDDEGMKAVAYGNLVGLLIESNKELLKRIEKLEDGITK
jgi:hypothetical protein